MGLESAIAVIFVCVLACAVGMGIAWYFVLDRWHDEKFEDFGLLAEDYNREQHKASMSAYLARKELAECKGVPFDEAPPERRVSVFDQYVRRRRREERHA